MIKKYFSLLYVAFSFISTHTVNIAITIDDYPLPNSGVFTVKERTEQYIKVCAERSCKVAFFCVGQHINDRNDHSLFTCLNDAGHFIANHSMNHRRSSKLSLAEFEKEITDVEPLIQNHDMFRRWFRYPYLDYGYQSLLGGSTEKMLNFLRLLHGLSYTEGYVTINTYDWHINNRLQQAIKQQKKIDYEKLRIQYLALLEEWIEYYITLYQEILGTEITHTLLLHDNDLTALYLPDILTMIKNKGWNIVSPEMAFQDTSWRKELLGKFELIKQKPVSLHENEIDKRLVNSHALYVEKTYCGIKQTHVYALLAMLSATLLGCYILRKP